MFFTDTIGVKKIQSQKDDFVRLIFVKNTPKYQKKGFKSEKYEFANIFNQIFLNGINFY